MGMGTTLTGLVVEHKTVTICGTLGALSSIGCQQGQTNYLRPVFIL